MLRNLHAHFNSFVTFYQINPVKIFNAQKKIIFLQCFTIKTQLYLFLAMLGLHCCVGFFV